MTCDKCEAAMEPGDSIGDSLGLCQMCWEDFCSDNWWSYMSGEGMLNIDQWTEAGK